MQKLDVYCEPFCLKEGYQFEVQHVVHGVDDVYSCFMHFHDVHELVIFEKVAGTYFNSQGQSELTTNDIVFTPSLETHDFNLQSGAKSWYIIQFSADFFERQGLTEILSFFQQGMHLRLSESHLVEVKQQLKWLMTSYHENPHSGKSITLLKLILFSLAEYATPTRTMNFQKIVMNASFDKMSPVIHLFHQDKSVDISLNEAAAMCHLSPSYFSRLFKRVFRCNFSEYSIQHKLYRAARLLGQSQFSVTDISYELNFSSPSHFIALFKKYFFITPHKYRAQMQNRITEKQSSD